MPKTNSLTHNIAEIVDSLFDIFKQFMVNILDWIAYL